MQRSLTSFTLGAEFMVLLSLSRVCSGPLICGILGEDNITATAWRDLDQGCLVHSIDNPECPARFSAFQTENGAEISHFTSKYFDNLSVFRWRNIFRHVFRKKGVGFLFLFLLLNL